jgi:hypothetical protein
MVHRTKHLWQEKDHDVHAGQQRPATNINLPAAVTSHRKKAANITCGSHPHAPQHGSAGCAGDWGWSSSRTTRSVAAVHPNLVSTHPCGM